MGHKHWDNPMERAAPAGARVPASYTVGGLTIRPATVLAPMAGVTDTVFRRFIREMSGCGLMMTEFTSADGVLRSKDKKARWEVYSNHMGEFAQRVPPGDFDYIIWADLKGFKPADGRPLHLVKEVTVHIYGEERQDTGLHLTH